MGGKDASLESFVPQRRFAAQLSPQANATCESFMKTLKQEEIYGRHYRDLDDLRTHVEEFLDLYYNQQRLHSALGYRTPAEFEQQSSQQGTGDLAQAPKMSFFRHRKSFDPMARTGIDGEPGSASPPHRTDEFPAGYSSASRSPAELASASPVKRNLKVKKR